MLSATTGLDDIRDCEAFVRSQLPRVILTPDLREELIAEGLRILVELHARYEPGRGGQDATESSFSGYAAKYLPGKLRDAWHRLEGTHHLVTNGDGREWRYDEKPRSLDRMNEIDPDSADRHRALQAIDRHESDFAETLGYAIDTVFAHRRKVALEVGVLLGMGTGTDEVARALRLRGSEVTAAVELIRDATPYLTRLEAA